MQDWSKAEGSTTSLKTGWSSSSLGSGGSWRDWRNKERFLLRYSLAHQEFFGQPQFVSTCLDASRVAGRKTVAALVALPSGYAAVAAPQVLWNFK